MKFFSASPKTTQKIAGFLAKESIIYKKGGNWALIFGLVGPLGAGKTSFVQGFARGLRLKRRLTSPTFVIFRKYPLKKGGYRNFFHVDCYRIKKTKELSVLGFKEILLNPKNIVMIEWADKIKSILPPHTIKIDFKHDKKENQRTITFDAL